VWSEERAHAAQPGAAPSGETAGPPPTTTPFEDTTAGLGPTPAPASADGGGEGASDLARLYLNLGRKDGASERDVRSLLEARAPGASVSDVEVMNTHTYLNVASGDATRVSGALTGQELGGRQLVCEPAKPRRR
jgi:hypothetical protein